MTMKMMMIGPTSLHIQHEIYIFICMICIVIGSLRGLYKEQAFHYATPIIITTTSTTATTATNNNTKNNSNYSIMTDYQFVLYIMIVLSRHILYRIYCTWDPSTYLYPSIHGILSYLCQQQSTSDTSSTLSLSVVLQQCYIRPINPYYILQQIQRQEQQQQQQQHNNNVGTKSKEDTLDMSNRNISILLQQQQQQQQQNSGSPTLFSSSSHYYLHHSGGTTSTSGTSITNSGTNSNSNNNNNNNSTTPLLLSSSPSSSSQTTTSTMALSATDRMIQLLEYCNLLPLTTMVDPSITSSKSSTTTTTTTTITTTTTTTSTSSIVDSFGILIQQSVPHWMWYTIQIPRLYILYPITKRIGTPQYNYYNNNGKIRNTRDESIRISNTHHHHHRVRNHHSHHSSNNNSHSLSNSPSTIVGTCYQYIVLLIQKGMIQIVLYQRYIIAIVQIILTLLLYYKIIFSFYTMLYLGSSSTSSIVSLWDLVFNNIGIDYTRNKDTTTTGTRNNIYINTLDYKRMQHTAEKEMAQMMGTYTQQPNYPSSITDVLFVLLGFSIMYNALLFSTINFPLPDLLSTSSLPPPQSSSSSSSSSSPPPGNNKDARTNRRGGGNHRNTTNHNNNNNNNNSRSFFTNGYVWLQEYVTRKSSVFRSLWDQQEEITMTKYSRLYVICFVVIGRILENIIVVGILPRTHFACRIMGHCDPRLSIWQVSRILYPGGLYTPNRMDSTDATELMESDQCSAVWTIIAVLMTSTALLLAQSLILNRSYLSNIVYHSQEWEIVSKEMKKNQRPSDDNTDVPWLSTSQHQTTTDIWDSRRKYMKGEVVYYPDWFGTLYRARVNAPEGHPKSIGFRILDEELSLELGHPATSRLISYLASIQFVFAVGYFVMWTTLILLGYYKVSYGLIWIVIACLISVHGVMSSVSNRAPSSVFYNDDRQLPPSKTIRALQKLNEEIMKNNC